MASPAFLRPACAIVALVSLSACELTSDRPDRFQAAAERVAAIPVGGEAALPSADERLRVEVMSPHALWDARDGVVSAATAAADLAAESPEIAEAVVREVVERTPLPTPGDPNAPEAKAVEPKKPAASADGLVQLGAYASETAAQEAWDRLASGSAGWALQGLSPVLEPVEVEGRRLVRLKVRAPAGGSAALCAAAGIDDPWCHR